MKTLAACALLLLLPCTVASAADKNDKKGITISFDSEDSLTKLAPRHTASDARIAITTRDGSTMMLMTKSAIAVQLTDATIAKIDAGNEAGFLEELVASGVRIALRKAVEYPLANVKNVEYRDGMLIVTNDQNKPVFTNVKVNGTEVMRNFSAMDATRIVNAFRAYKRR